jgi:hypothetical protein
MNADARKSNGTLLQRRACAQTDATAAFTIILAFMERGSPQRVDGM